MSQFLELDENLVIAISGGVTSFAALAAERNSNVNLVCSSNVLRQRLQALRKRSLIDYTHQIGWFVVPAPHLAADSRFTICFQPPKEGASPSKEPNAKRTFRNPDQERQHLPYIPL